MASPKLYIPSAETQKSLVNYLNSALYSFSASTIRARLEENDKLYAREKDLTVDNVEAGIQNKLGNADALKNITMPIVQPQVDAAVTYQTAVFLTGHPLFGVVTPPEHVDAGRALETVLDNQARKGKWVKEIKKTLADGFKHDMGLAEVTWAKVKSPALVETAGGVVASSTTWEGNTVRHLDLYNTFWDTRVSIVDLASKGEFVGYTERISFVGLKEYILSSPTGLISSNEGAVFKASSVNRYYTPTLRADPSDVPVFSWSNWAGLSDTQKSKLSDDTYELTTLYCKIVPKYHEMQVPSKGTPQIWKLVFVNDSVLLVATLLNNAHNMLPVLGLQPSEDGLGYQSKSLLENVEPMQTVSSSLMNSVLASRRKSIYDRGIYDPTMIDSEYMDGDEAYLTNIPLKPSAYGRSVNDAYRAIPFEDNQVGTLLGLISNIDSMADRVSGQNKAQQGQFVKGNKTREEYTDIMANANGKSQVISILLEDQFFSPLKDMLKLNILQYQGADTVYSRELKTNVNVDPVALRKATLEFKLSDGLVPSDKLMNQSVFTSALQMLSASERLGAPYNIGSMVSYLFKTQGADIGDFEKSQEQQNYERAVMQWQQVAMAYAEQGKEFTAPQPTPEQFGWNTGTKPSKSTSQGKTILEQVMEGSDGNTR